ncbi:hypothetical protein NHX12_020982 [Muraenolepis orangiensis]|uniref:G-protein coupled receptors family 1 profile domain-containing protein n=1 Tax=Muraenolepis orangiensis TaxID=630683 RepID=A0A9Q0ES77_9TELE|nr:hypothetical protein NHX12_020982 [Muraenolepis orangiensis]
MTLPVTMAMTLPRYHGDDAKPVTKLMTPPSLPRLVEEAFTVDEVREMLEGLQAVVVGEVETELINTAHTNVLLLRQLFSQADKFYLRLQSDISELENRDLLEQVAEFEKTDFKTTNKTTQEISKPKLAPLNEGGVSELLKKEITRLQEENEKLKGRLRNLESQAMSVLDEKTKAERALKDLRMVQGDQQVPDFLPGPGGPNLLLLLSGALPDQDQDQDLESTVAALREDYERSLDVSAASQKDLQQNLVTAKHELLHVREQLAMAEKELDRKFQQTAAYRNMKEMLTNKNEQIKDIRKRLQSFNGIRCLYDLSHHRLPNCKYYHVKYCSIKYYHVKYCSIKYYHVKYCSIKYYHVKYCSIKYYHVKYCSIKYYHDPGSGYPEDYDLDENPCLKTWVRDFQRRFEPPLFLLIFVLGTAGNLLVVLVHWTVRHRLKTMTDVYLVNLAVADLLFLATLPFWAVNAMQGWAFGPYSAGLCTAVVAVYKLNFFSGMLLLTCISVDRYVAIVQVTRAHNLRRARRMLYSRGACLAVWLLSSLLALPEVLLAQVRKSSSGLTTCDLRSGTRTGTKVLVLSLQVAVGFVLPLAVMAACYSSVLRALLQARSFQKHKALRVILAVVLAFALSQLPCNAYLVLTAWRASSPGGGLDDCGAATRADVVGQVTKSLAYAHACLNPFLYAFVGVRFREDLLRVFRWYTGRPSAGDRGKTASVAKRPSAMSETETAAALSL